MNLDHVALGLLIMLVLIFGISSIPRMSGVFEDSLNEIMGWTLTLLVAVWFSSMILGVFGLTVLLILGGVLVFVLAIWLVVRFVVWLQQEYNALSEEEKKALLVGGNPNYPRRF